MRTVASTELLVDTPANTSGGAPPSRRNASSPVPMKALFVRLGSTRSPGRGANAGRKSLPGWPGR